MAVSIGFALGIVAGATVITRITFSKQTEQKVLYIFGVIGMVIGTLCSMWFVVKLFWKWAGKGGRKHAAEEAAKTGKETGMERTDEGIRSYAERKCTSGKATVGTYADTCSRVFDACCTYV